MAEQKKDMTGLMEYAKAMQDAGQAPPVPAGSVMEEAKIEKIDDFESLEDYGKKNPAPEPAAFDPSSSLPGEDAFATSAAEPPPEPSPELAFEAAALDPAMGNDPSPASDSIPGLETFNSTPAFEAPPEIALSSSEPATSTANDLFPINDLAASLPPPEPKDSSSMTSPEPTITAPSTSEAISAAVSVTPDEPRSPPEPLIPEPVRPAPRLSSSSNANPSTPLQKVKQYSESITPRSALAQAAYPFSLLITGKLAPDEQARLLDILSRENMGIREIDLEPQFESGKILIPRISEYAGVMLVSALRSTQARMRLGPSDTIFATEDTQDPDDASFDTGERSSSSRGNDNSHPAENVPLTTGPGIPELGHYVVIDVVMASAALKSNAVETESTTEYSELLEALTRELKYKAFRRGATAILNFNVQLTQLQLPSHYRLLVTGSAVKAKPDSTHGV